MPNTFFGLSIGKSGLYTYQAALNTAAHNSANVDTKGYSRQQVVQSASNAISVNSRYGMQGTGVDVNSVIQIRDQYYDTKFWKNNAVYGDYNCKAYYLDCVQGYFSEVNTEGHTAAFDDMFAAMSSLGNDVSNGTIRTQVTEFSASLTETFNSMYNRLQTLQKECNDEIKNTADQINSIAERVSSLTVQINTIEVGGAHANDLRDARNRLIDELSSLANTSVTETPLGDGTGVNQYIVRIDGKVLVDTYNYSTLIAEPDGTSVNQNDTPGLYTVKWSDGQTFDSASPTLGGKMQSLFEVRDGNNKMNFTGKGNGVQGDKSITVTGANINDIMNLNIPDSKGCITIGARDYTYNSFEVKVETDGSYTYTFELTEGLKENMTDKNVKIGESVDYKGIPYYQSQLNEFVRTFSRAFNDIHKEGEDLLNGDHGMDYFTGILAGSGDEYSFDTVFTGFSSLPDPDTDKDAKGYVKASYYHVTAGNLKVNASILDDPRLIACAQYDENTDTGIEDKTILDKLLGLKDDMNLFKQGTPDMFLQTMVGEMGIDAKAAATFAKGQDDILKMIDGQRMSISGVDSDEEAMNIMKFREAYNLNSKVISIMNEIYDKLINGTGV